MIKLAVIGDPIGHSLSPMVHGALMRVLSVECQYDKVHVSKGDLQSFLEYARTEGLSGFNLTMPHKVDILPYLDEISPAAAAFSSVNTVRIRDGRFYGYNTDGDGYKEALRLSGYSMEGRRVVLLGAGGVARVIGSMAAEVAESLVICNRNGSGAKKLAEELSCKGKVIPLGMEFTDQALKSVCTDCDLLINATPLGMEGMEEDFEDLSFLDQLPSHALVSDLIYCPARTKLLQRAEERGLAVLNGLGMLIMQALLADEIYLDVSLDRQSVFKQVCRDVQNALITKNEN